LYHVETYLKIYFLVSSLLGWRDATLVAFVACLLAVFRMLKRPRLNQEFLK
jgi:hypothetical protein